jgi:hypothetical protein
VTCLERGASYRRVERSVESKLEGRECACA